MSAQFGRWNFDGKPVEQTYLERVSQLIAPYGPDGQGGHSEGDIVILHRPFHITKQSRRETQPHSSLSGAVLTWDGILDNRAELIQELKPVATTHSTDIEIVASAYEQWGNECFARFIGDWALVLWNRATRSLLLAKDFAGTRPLYYSLEKKHLTWSTILDPLVILADKAFAFEEEYIAGWISSCPAVPLTPYRGISSVPPATVLEVRPAGFTIKKYWDFDPARRIRYRLDAEYQEHFRIAFRESVRRRLCSDSPILAELSGGIDSSSIVCMADTIIKGGGAVTPRLDTVSYYDDSEPSWNERPYFTQVEEMREQVGCHIDVGGQRGSGLAWESGAFAVLPGARNGSSPAAKQFATCLAAQTNRVLLSGTGGDEFLGGVPTAIPELADLLLRARWRVLSHQLKVWALAQRRPWLHLLVETVRRFFPSPIGGISEERKPAQWFDAHFVSRHRAALRGYQKRWRVFGPLPSFQDNLETLEALRGQLSCSIPAPDALHVKRYPYLDRDLLEFLWALPAEQLVRPGQRRSLIRRSLVGIVPEGLLNRKRKAFLTRSPTLAVSSQWSRLASGTEPWLLEALGVVNTRGLSRVLEDARRGLEVPVVTLMRVIQMEAWLRQPSLASFSLSRQCNARIHRDTPLSKLAKELRT